MNPVHPASTTRAVAPRSSLLARGGFTLVELLVVITIIGILASLIVVAAVGAMRRAQLTRIKLEIDNMAGAFDTYRDKAGGAYPPNAQTDGNDPIDDVQVLADLKRHMNQAFPRHREPDALIAALAGLNTSPNLTGGMTAGEALVFWLSGASADPKYPISGEGGPSYPIPGLGQTGNNQLDPIETRNWVFPFAVERLGPRDADGFFDGTANRFIEYSVDVNGVTQLRRINFWQYLPANSEEPYLYFDVSRHPAAVLNGSAVTGPYDPPASTAATAFHNEPLHVHAIKKVASSTAANVPIEFANAGKFQILHAGIDGDWGEEEFERRMSAHGTDNPSDLSSYLLYPDGPFTLEIADTLTNFTEGTLEDSQP